MDLLWVLLVGAVIGWLAGVIMKGQGFGILGNIIIGILGAFLGKWVFVDMLGLVPEGSLGRFGVALGGAILLILILRTFKKA